MDAIFTREWKSYFLSSIGYIFAGVFLALSSFFFVNGALMYQSADINVVLSNINIIYLFLISILTMGLFASEKTRRTDRLLLTSPISVSKIVVAKYLAAMWVFGVTLILSLIYPIIFRIFGAPATGEVWGAYIGFILLWGSFIAIGTFISALTENQMIAAVVTFGVLLVVFYLNSFAAGISIEWVSNILRWFSLMDRYREFQSGILSIVSVIYYLSFIFVFLFLTVQVIRRGQVSDTKLKLNNIVVTSAAIAGVILINAIVSTIGAKIPLKIDLTKDKVYNYSEQTKEVLANLDENVNIYALYPETLEGEFVVTIREYLKSYERMSENIEVIYKDPYKEPAFARKYGNDVAIGSVIVEKDEKFRVIPVERVYRENSYSGTVSVDIENQLTSAISYVSGEGKEVKIYFIKGHNEFAGNGSNLATAIESEGYVVDEIMISAEGIPGDADMLVSLSPSVDFTAEERDALDDYIQKGGKVVFVLAAGTEPLERLYSYLAEWGITANNDFVIENDIKKAFRSQEGVPVPAPEIMKHTITEKIIGSDVNFIAPASCSFSLKSTNPQYATVAPLLVTSKKSWGVKDLNSASLEKKDGDISGPLVISAVAEKQEGGSIFVIGSLQAIETQGILENSSYCNGDFVLNAFSYLTDKGDALNIRAKVISPDTLTMTEQQVKIIAVLVQYVLPLLILLAGLVIWFRRRYL